MFRRSMGYFFMALALLGCPGAFAQTLNYGQYQSMLTMKDFFQEKIVDNQLYKSIEFVDTDSSPVPTFEAYHESNSWQTDDESIWLGNLRTGARLHFNLAPRGDTPVSLDPFCLLDFNFISSPSGYLPVIDVPFPYIMNIAETAKEIMPGVSLYYGNPITPYVQVSYGHSFFDHAQASSYFDAIEPINVFDVRSPMYGMYLQVFQSGETIDFSSNTTVSFGLMGKVPWLRNWLNDRLDPYRETFRNIYTLMRLEEITNKYASNDLGSTHFGVNELLGYVDFDFAVNHGGGRGIRTGWWRLGGTCNIETDKSYSSIYKTKIQLRGGMTYRNVNDYRGFFLLPFNNNNYSGLGGYVEVTLQNPLSQSFDYFLLFFEMNAYVFQVVSGSDASSTLENITDKITDIVSKEMTGQYNSNFFDRITIGFEMNNPDILAIHPFTLGQGHVYCYISAFI